VLGTAASDVTGDELADLFVSVLVVIASDKSAEEDGLMVVVAVNIELAIAP
jgi:hypothetical protein